MNTVEKALAMQAESCRMKAELTEKWARVRHAQTLGFRVEVRAGDVIVFGKNGAEVKNEN